MNATMLSIGGIAASELDTLAAFDVTPDVRPRAGLSIAGLGEVDERIAAHWSPRSPLRTTESVRTVAVGAGPGSMIESIIDPGEVALMPGLITNRPSPLFLIPVNELTEYELSRERGMNTLLDEILGGEDVYALPYYLGRAKVLGVEKEFDVLDWLSAWRSA